MIDERWGATAARAYPYCVVAPFVALPFLPRGFNAVFLTWTSIALGGLLCLLAAVAGTRRSVSRTVGLATVASLACATWFSASALWAVDPRIALYSPRAASVWVLLAVWLCAGSLVADARTLRETLAVVSGAGAFIAVAAFAETLGSGYQRTQGYAAGFLENSTSSGAMLAVAAVACVAGLLVSRTAVMRAYYGACLIVSAVALVLSSSRAAWVGLIAVGLLAAAIRLARVPRARWWLYAAVPTAFAGAFSALEVAASLGVLGVGARSTLAIIGTDRDAVWRSAWAQFARSPLVGEGIGQFSATIQAGLSGVPTATYDTHNILIGAAVGTGIIGFLLVLLTFFTAMAAGARVALDSTGSRAITLLACLPVFMLAVGLFAWVDSAALLCLAALFGALMGSYASRSASADEPRVAQTGVLRAIAVVAAIGALAFSAVDAMPVSLLYRYGKSESVTTAPTLNEALDLYRKLPGGRTAIYLLGVVRYHVNTGSQDAKDRAPDVLRMVRRDATADVTVATKAIALAQTLGDANAPEGFALVEELAAAGAKADPASGQWYTLCAYDAQRRGMEEMARAYATKALGFPQDPETRSKLEAIAGS